MRDGRGRTRAGSWDKGGQLGQGGALGQRGAASRCQRDTGENFLPGRWACGPGAGCRDKLWMPNHCKCSRPD